MSREQWMVPSPLWGDVTHGLAGPGEVRFRPWLTMFTGDNFLPDFLDLLAGKIEGEKPNHLVTKVPDHPDKDKVVKLYQPVLERYYLVTASLVCQLSGLPDHRIDPNNDEEVFFVLRRQLEGREQAWIPRKGWQNITPSELMPLNEEKLKLFPVKVAAAISEPGPFADAFGLSTPGKRLVYFGYVPVTNREKYLKTGGNNDENLTYIIRLAYARPGCPPVVSLPSLPFRLAPAFDPGIPLIKRGQKEGSPPEPPLLKPLLNFEAGLEQVIKRR